MTTRFEIIKDGHPEGNRYSVVDRETGRPALVRDVPQVWLPEDEAEEIAALLNVRDAAEASA